MNQQTKWQNIVSDLNEMSLNQTDDKLLKTYQDALIDIQRQAKKYLDEYELLSFSKRLEVERLLDIGEKIQKILDRNNQSVIDIVTISTAEHVKNGYYGSFYALEGAENINLPVSMLNEKYIESIVNQPVDESTLSDRLYSNSTQLAKTTTSSLIQGAVNGKGYDQIAEIIAAQTGADYKRALRIARTEGHRASSTATQRAYEEAKGAGTEIQKKWLSTLSKNTRHSHAQLDGQKVEIEEEFVSPISGAHGMGPGLMGTPAEDINCRCTTITVVNGIEPGRRYDNDIGKSVPSMNYNEWMEWKQSREYNEYAFKGIKADNLKISGISDHALKRMKERNIWAGDMMNALNKPLDVGPVKIDPFGRSSRAFIGEFATVYVNSEDGTIASTNPTHRKLVRKLKKG